MWIKQALFEKLIEDRSEAEGRATVLTQRITAQDVTLDWLKVRLTQLEYERAQLIHNYMGIKMPVVEFSTAEPVVTADQVLQETVNYDDIGDAEAKAQGLDWDAEGRLTKHGKLVQ